LEVAGLVVGVAVVAEGRAVGGDGGEEDALDVGEEEGGLGAGEGGGAFAGVEAGGVEGFVDVDVAQAGDEGLVEEGGFEGAFGGAEEGVEVGWGEGEGFGAEAEFGGVAGREVDDLAEAAGVGESQMEDVGGQMRGGGWGEDDREVGVGEGGVGLLVGGMGGVKGEVAGHAEVEVEGGVVVEGEDDAFGSAVEGGDGAGGEQGGEGQAGGWGAGEGAVGGDVEAGLGDGENRAAGEVRQKGIDDGLDLGEFGHGGRRIWAGGEVKLGGVLFSTLWLW